MISAWEVKNETDLKVENCQIGTKHERIGDLPCKGTEASKCTVCLEDDNSGVAGAHCEWGRSLGEWSWKG